MMHDTAHNVIPNTADAARWEDEKARPMWSSSGSAPMSVEQQRDRDRRRPLAHDGNTLLM